MCVWTVVTEMHSDPHASVSVGLKIKCVSSAWCSVTAWRGGREVHREATSAYLWLVHGVQQKAAQPRKAAVVQPLSRV